MILRTLVLLLFSTAALAQDPPVGVLADIGVDQKLDARLPLDIPFKDESGKDVRIGEYFHDKPVVLSLVYYECPMLCSMTLNGLVRSLRPLAFNVGNEFEVLTVSFDPKDTPPLAQAKKNAYLKDYGRKGADAGWHFLTGTPESIRRLTDAVGYRYQWDSHTSQWAHVSAIMVLTPEGKVSQYLYGIEFSPRDLRLSLIQAGKHKIGTVVDRVLLYCYHYIPTTGKYGFAIMTVIRLAGLGTVLGLAGFVAMHWRS